MLYLSVHCHFAGAFFQVETQIVGDNEIDFGLQGCRITRRDFVGLRQIQSFSQVPPLPATFVPADDPTPVETATRLATALGSALTDTWQWLSDQNLFGISLPSPLHVLPVQPMVLPADAASSTKPDGLLDDTQFQAEAARAAGADGLAQDQAQEHQSSEVQPPPSTSLGGPVRGNEGSANGGAEEQEDKGNDTATKWEILWKDHAIPGQPLRRLEFSCNQAGQAAIQERLSEWQELARSPAALVEASQAASQACGGVLTETLRERSHRDPPKEAVLQGKDAAVLQGKEAAVLQGREAAGGAGKAEPSGEQVTISQGGDEGTRGSCGRDLESASDMAAWGVREGDNAIRWGSVAVVGRFMPSRNGHSLILRPGHFMAVRPSYAPYLPPLLAEVPSSCTTCVTYDVRDPTSLSLHAWSLTL